MKFKLDEHLDVRLVSLITEGGHDVKTVQEQGISGCKDHPLYDHCVREQRTLITLDLGFSNPFPFPPEPTAGIVVVRRLRPVLRLVRATLKGALQDIKSGAARGKLWIVEPGRIRIYEPSPEES